MLRHNTHEYHMLYELLGSDEKPYMEVVERRLGGAKWFGTAHAYATNKRIIIIRRYTFGLHNSLKIIKYGDVAEIKLERGIIYSKLHFALQGEQQEDARKWIVGLKYNEALEIIKFINRIDAKPVVKK